MKYSLNKREKILSFVAIAVFVFYVFYTVLLTPQLEHNRSLSRKIASESDQLSIARSKVRALKALEERENRGELKVVRISDFLAFVSNQALLSGLDIESIVPRREEKQKGLGEILTMGEKAAAKRSGELAIQVQMKGTYLGLLEFLHAFEKGIIPAAATGLNISKSEGEASLDIGVIFTTSFYSGLR